jgi:hypothetical protein
MGDHADDAVNDCIDYGDDVWAYYHGQMDAETAISRGVIDEHGANFPSGRSRYPKRYAMKVECSVEEGELENDRGVMVPGVQATCSRCDHVTESFGTSERSVKRCLALFREECPNGEANYYVDDSGE